VRRLSPPLAGVKVLVRSLPPVAAPGAAVLLL
jgi:hypothetical protein